MEIMVYADDTQLYTSLTDTSSITQLENFERCLNDIIHWYQFKMMKCNPEKTKFIHFSSKFKNVSSSFKIFADGHEVKLVEDAVDLGVILDSSLSMKKQVSKLCSSASITLRKISSNSKFLDRKVLARLVHAFIFTKLDYCNSILYGLPGGEIQGLQRIQNAAARLITKCKIQDHISPILDQLHWLTIKKEDCI